jgi:hypothetical protein
MQKLESLPQRDAAFIEPMECLAVAKLPEGPEWLHEIKLDGYRAVAINSKGKLNLYSKNRKSFHSQYPYIIEALGDLPENTRPSPRTSISLWWKNLVNDGTSTWLWGSTGHHRRPIG